MKQCIFTREVYCKRGVILVSVEYRCNVFGQSAGAMSTQTLVSSRLTKDWIAKAIFQSGGGYQNGLNRGDMTLAFQEKLGSYFVEAAGAKNLEEIRSFGCLKGTHMT